MKTDEVVYLLRRLGLSLEVDDGRLIVTPANLIDDDTRWLIRKHRDAIIAELEDVPRWAWLVRLDGHTIETYHHPESTYAEVMRKYPAALSIVPLPECLWPVDPAKDAVHGMSIREPNPMGTAISRQVARLMEITP